ncbi:hypothetical protein AKJ09_11037 [Labilithrix luteola]|uniref:BNR repeat domain protein n=1 Tax=Labilithrix luteola TaxID=1391654 RepID=A0A0K1QF32_9BACT|nr:RCC1 domain-containing protein [Labilithrix luteola]AKV04374.1 hypothetical protein AKJ09_11037 [Labilithrix luteola]
MSRAIVAACGMLSCAAANCASDEVGAGLAEGDGTPDASLADSGSDAPLEDAPSRDAAPFDATPPPVECTTKPCATALTSTSVGDAQTVCALLDDGTVACWGANDQGQLGRGDDAGAVDSATPKRVVGIDNVVAIARTCAVDKNGSAYCWGKGPYLVGDAADVTTERTPVKLPLERVKKISVNTNVGCAMVEDGVVCWGVNTNGQIAPFDGSDRSMPRPPQTVALPPGAKARDIKVSNATLVALEDGSMVSWGASPPLGRVTSLSPDTHPQPLAIAGITTAIAMEIDNGCAAVSGVGYCWGAGPPNPRNIVDLSRALPTPIALPEPVRQISMPAQRVLWDPNRGESLVPNRGCAVGVSGAVYCWGNNTSGQAGDGTKDHAYEAVQVRGLPAPAVKVEPLFDATCALLTSGRIYCWGSDFYGQLGTGNLKVSSLTPQEVLLP